MQSPIVGLYRAISVSVQLSLSLRILGERLRMGAQSNLRLSSKEGPQQLTNPVIHDLFRRPVRQPQLLPWTAGTDRRRPNECAQLAQEQRRLRLLPERTGTSLRSWTRNFHNES